MWLENVSPSPPSPTMKVSDPSVTLPGPSASGVEANGSGRFDTNIAAMRARIRSLANTLIGQAT